jgi:putative mRNA 3-end processing factor
MDNIEPPLERGTYGYKLPNTQVYLDPKKPVACAIISHAHGDHAIPGHDVVYCTANTAKLLRSRFRNFATKIITPDWLEKFEVEGIPFRFASAGHMLGSAQIAWERNGLTSVYTGDFKRQKDSSCEPFQVVACDILITESTFAQPDKIHPPPEECILNLKNYPPVNFVIGAYSLGKSQRLTQLFNEFIPDFQVMVHPKIAKYHKVYEEAGFNLGSWTPFQRQVFRKGKGIIYLIPPSVLQTFAASPYYLRGMASGWEHLQTGYELVLPVSDHADWKELTTTIDDCGAKTIYTVHGDGSKLKEKLTSSHIRIEEL